MNTIWFLAEWALRSSMLIAGGTFLLWVLRVKDSSIRLAAWIAMLAGSLAIPGLTAALPALPFAMVRVIAPRIQAPSIDPAATYGVVTGPQAPVSPRNASERSSVVPVSFDGSRAVLISYCLVAGVLLLRLFAGLAISLRLLRDSSATGQTTEGIEIRQSNRVTSPVTLGIARPAIILPGDWREWARPKLDAVLAHERSHIRRHDLSVQVLSAVHRALLWHSPLSWFLHRRIVRVAEEASDDAALAIHCDRASYAEVVLDFMQRGVRRQNWHGVAMARYGCPDERIHRILDGKAISRGVTRRSVVAILVLGLPVAYVASAAHAQNASKLPLPVTPEATDRSTLQRPPTLVAINSPVQGPLHQAARLQIRPPSPTPAAASEGAAVILVIDRSSSMEGPKLELARNAVSSVVDHLRATDTVGVLTFANAFAWAFTPTHPDDRAMIKRLLLSIMADGGTQIAPALTEAYNRVLPLSASYKHIVLLTDGISEEGDSMDLARSANSRKITISTVGLGRDVNRDYLERVAQLAGGRAYFLVEPQELERTLLQDVLEHTGSTVAETPK